MLNLPCTLYYLYLTTAHSPNNLPSQRIPLDNPNNPLSQIIPYHKINPLCIPNTLSSQIFPLSASLPSQTTPFPHHHISYSTTFSYIKKPYHPPHPPNTLWHQDPTIPQHPFHITIHLHGSAMNYLVQSKMVWPPCVLKHREILFVWTSHFVVSPRTPTHP